MNIITLIKPYVQAAAGQRSKDLRDRRLICVKQESTRIAGVLDEGDGKMTKIKKRSKSRSRILSLC